MITIWKFPIEITLTREQTITVPENPHVLHVGLDPEGTPCIWCQVLTTNRRIDMSVAVVGTGHPCPQGGVYRGSFNQGPFVWHVFTRG